MQQREKAILDVVQSLGKKKGVNGQEDQGKIDISEIIKELNQTVGDKKQKMAPVIKELRAWRQQVADLEADYLEKKKQYDLIMVGVER